GMDSGRLDVRLLHPRGSAPDEHVRGAGGRIRRLIVTADRGAALHDARAEAILVERSNENRVAIVAQHVRDAERVSVLDVGRLQVIRLFPLTNGAGEDVPRAPSVASREASARVRVWRSRWVL